MATKELICLTEDELRDAVESAVEAIQPEWADYNFLADYIADKIVDEAKVMYWKSGRTVAV